MTIQRLNTNWTGAMADLYNGHRGTFLTAYISNKDQLESVIYNAERLMRKKHEAEIIDDFLKPLRRLGKDPLLFSESRRGSWALFRSEAQFRIKRLENQVPALSVVSNSFHVKPLIKHWQNGGKYNLLYVNTESAVLFEKTLTGFKAVDELPILGGPIHMWIDDWIQETLQDKSAPLVLAGESWAIKSFLRQTRLNNIFPQTLETQTSPNTKAQLQKEAEEMMLKTSLKQELLYRHELIQASHKGHATFNLERVAKALVRKDISRLYLAEDKHVWGLFDEKTGEIQVHPNQKDCQDEDILDDLAELAMRHGVEVVLLPQSEISKTAPAAAILNRKLPLLEVHKSVAVS